MPPGVGLHPQRQSGVPPRSPRPAHDHTALLIHEINAREGGVDRVRRQLIRDWHLRPGFPRVARLDQRLAGTYRPSALARTKVNPNQVPLLADAAPSASALIAKPEARLR